MKQKSQIRKTIEKIGKRGWAEFPAGTLAQNGEPLSGLRLQSRVSGLAHAVSEDTGRFFKTRITATGGVLALRVA